MLFVTKNIQNKFIYNLRVFAYGGTGTAVTAMCS